MNSPAIKQNAPSWPELFARASRRREEARLRRAREHRLRRPAAALRDAAAAVPGRPPPAIPGAGAIQGVGAAGRRAGLLRLLHARQEAAAVDPSAGGLLAPVTDLARRLLDPGVRHRERGQPRSGARRPAQGPVARGLHRRALPRAGRLGSRRHQSPASAGAARLRACREDALRVRLPARGQSARCTRPSRRRARLPRRRQRVRDRAGIHEGLRAARAGAAVQPHRRAERARRGAALPVPGAACARETALVADRCRRRVRGLCQRHHAHVFIRRRRVRRAHQAVRRPAIETLRAGARRRSTGGISTRPRIAPSASSCARPASSR